ncbi:NFACT family protein, partial [Candidatus Micrarchaeota archaeon]|nr:NFACT family protein [Candidatus Micrarchaeota archaeon]
KAKEISNGKISLKIGKEWIVFELGRRMNISYILEEGTVQNNFIQKIRKELGGARFISAEQHASDRIIILNFDKGNEKSMLVFEMFGKGNAVFVKDGITVSCYKRERWKDRETSPGKEYSFPESNITLDLNDALNSDKYAVVCMMRLPLGKKYAKEVLQRAGVDEKTPGNKIEKKIGPVKEEYIRIIKEAEPFGFYKGDELADFGLAEFSDLKNLKIKKFKTLSEPADTYYSKKSEIKKSSKTERLEKLLESQLSMLEEYKMKESEYRSKGDLIYEHFQEVENQIAENRKKGKIILEF